jgi:Leucine-rich repeat (LRR) protein
LKTFFAIKNKINSVFFSENSCLDSLITLGLNENLIETFTLSKGTLQSLQILELRGNKITSFVVDKEFESLKKIDLGENMLTSVPKSILQLSFIQKIDLSYNPISKLSKELFYLNSLQKIECQSCKLLDLPKLDKNCSLLDLFLGGNLITEVDLQRFDQLEEVELSDNPIVKITLNNNYKIKFLDISNTSITSSEASIVKEKVEVLINNSDKEDNLDKKH